LQGEEEEEIGEVAEVVEKKASFPLSEPQL
jgi:hypothetical protein